MRRSLSSGASARGVDGSRLDPHRRHAKVLLLLLYSVRVLSAEKMWSFAVRVLDEAAVH